MTGQRTLLFYLARQFAVGFALMLMLLLGIVYMMDTAELLRRTADNPQIETLSVLGWSLLKLPEAGLQTVIFAVLFGAILTFWRLTRSHELIVVRAFGLSVWRFLAPAACVAFLIGIVMTTMVNPISAMMLDKFERFEQGTIKGESVIVFKSGGLWLRQRLFEQTLILRAQEVDAAEHRLDKVTILRFDDNDRYLGRIDADTARLERGKWRMDKAMLTDPLLISETRQLEVPTDLTWSRIEHSFTSPHALSFWNMPETIRVIEETGFPATRLRLYFQARLAEPLMFMAVVMLAACISLRPQRRGGTALMIAVGILIAFCLFFMRNLIYALGLSGAIPVTLAAWSPAFIVLLAAVTMLLHMEDG